MMRLLVILIALLTMGATNQCSTTAVVLPEGPIATQLGAEKDKQIAGLVAQVKAEQAARLMDQALAAKAASGLKGIQKARTYLEESPVKEAIGLESDLALTRLPPDDPAETVKALERVVLIVTGQRDEAEKRYKEADAQTKVERAAKEAKDKELANQDIELKKRADALIQLAKDKDAETVAHKADFEKAMAAKDAEIKRIKDENASKERATWILWTRLAGLGLIVIGVVLMVVFKVIVEGAGLAASGVIIGLISIFIDWLTNQPWFPWLMGVILLGTIIAGGVALYRMWMRHELDKRKTQAIQDMRDEAAAKGDTKAIDALDEHLEYRMGKDGSFWQKAQLKTEVDLGLIDPEGEKAVAPVAPEAPQS